MSYYLPVVLEYWATWPEVEQAVKSVTENVTQLCFIDYWDNDTQNEVRFCLETSQTLGEARVGALYLNPGNSKCTIEEVAKAILYKSNREAKFKELLQSYGWIQAEDPGHDVRGALNDFFYAQCDKTALAPAREKAKALWVKAEALIAEGVLFKHNRTASKRKLFKPILDGLRAGLSPQDIFELSETIRKEESMTAPILQEFFDQLPGKKKEIG